MDMKKSLKRLVAVVLALLVLTGVGFEANAMNLQPLTDLQAEET